jgi:N-acetyl-1-D-myo-inositol-2-amino-2-deoxy-alpha-D-glucopyranoside deacetylase/mycothiol S-conjugate amidase
MTPFRLLFSLAHPDDEAFGSGALIARYVQQGVQVDYILGTDGGRGTVPPEILERYGGSVAAVRSAEMECAAATLGFHEVVKLGYGDSGMMGSPENDDPACLWQADETEVTGKIVAVLRRLRPQVVVTFDPFGAYGHPDHIFMHRATKRAFFAAGDPAQFPEAGPAYAPQKLYYTAFPRVALNLFIALSRWRGEDPSKIGTNKDLNLLAIRQHAQPITTRVAVGAYQAIAEKAAACHASQIGPRQRIPRLLRAVLGRQQALTRYHPPLGLGEKMEHDLFAGVRAE